MLQLFLSYGSVNKVRNIKTERKGRERGEKGRKEGRKEGR